MNDPSASFQTIAQATRHASSTFDEYSITATQMPDDLTAEQLMLNFAKAPNKAIRSGTFDFINKFKKRREDRIEIGDIFDIDILGPDNGSIVLVATSDGFGNSSGDTWFDIQTIRCDKYGAHPESGAREFGFEYVEGGAKFYTRGHSRPFIVAGKLGAPVQRRGWLSMMNGIKQEIEARGGTIAENSVHEEKAYSLPTS